MDAVTQPLGELLAMASCVLRWEQPGVSAMVFSTLQFLALSERLAYLPALAVLATAAHVWLLRRRRRRRRREDASRGQDAAASDEENEQQHEAEEQEQDTATAAQYCVEYQYKDGTLRTKVRNLNEAVRPAATA